MAPAQSAPAAPPKEYPPIPHIPPPTPAAILLAYTGTFRSIASAAPKTITITLVRRQLSITYPLNLFGRVNPAPSSTAPTAPSITTKTTIGFPTKFAPPAPTTATSTLFLGANGVPQVRVSGAENEGLQAVGYVHPEGKIVGFDVGGGESGERGV